MLTGLGLGPSECCESKRGRLKSTRVVCGYRCIMMATMKVTITQQITLQLAGQYYMNLRYHEFTMKTKN